MSVAKNSFKIKLTPCSSVLSLGETFEGVREQFNLVLYPAQLFEEQNSVVVLSSGSYSKVSSLSGKEKKSLTIFQNVRLKVERLESDCL